MGYFPLAMPAALVMRKAGYKAGFIIGLLLYSVGAFLFWPAALMGQYGYFLCALFVIASGLSFLETALAVVAQFFSLLARKSAPGAISFSTCGTIPTCLRKLLAIF